MLYLLWQNYITTLSMTVWFSRVHCIVCVPNSATPLLCHQSVTYKYRGKSFLFACIEQSYSYEYYEHPGYPHAHLTLIKWWAKYVLSYKLEPSLRTAESYRARKNENMKIIHSVKLCAPHTFIIRWCMLRTFIWLGSTFHLFTSQRRWQKVGTRQDGKRQIQKGDKFYSCLYQRRCCLLFLPCTKLCKQSFNMRTLWFEKMSYIGEWQCHHSKKNIVRHNVYTITHSAYGDLKVNCYHTRDIPSDTLQAHNHF